LAPPCPAGTARRHTRSGAAHSGSSPWALGRFLLGHERLLAWRRRVPPALRAVRLGAEQLTQAPLPWHLAAACLARSAFSFDAAVTVHLRHYAPPYFTLAFERTGTPLLHRRPWLLCTLLIRLGSLPLEVLRGLRSLAGPDHLPRPLSTRCTNRCPLTRRPVHGSRTEFWVQVDPSMQTASAS
jgi:hypothetical protein